MRHPKTQHEDGGKLLKPRAAAWILFKDDYIIPLIERLAKNAEDQGNNEQDANGIDSEDSDELQDRDEDEVDDQEGKRLSAIFKYKQRAVTEFMQGLTEEQSQQIADLVEERNTVGRSAPLNK